VTDAVTESGTFRRREEVLRVAARLFFERRYAATSTADIARARGLHRGSVYYLSTKEDLLYELVQDCYASGASILRRSAKVPTMRSRACVA
jgi:AcrR family transcriptional regulator